MTFSSRGHFLRASLLGLGIIAMLAAILFAPRARAADESTTRHLGVASCAGSTCHGRQEPTGAVVRQDEILLWQNAASQAGAHSRAWKVLGDSRGRMIAARLGIGDPQSSRECVGCHADPAPSHGPAWKISDGVGCEACHGGADARWLSSHRATGATHAANVANGLYPIDQPKMRAARCLDCHFGSGREGQWVDHRIMAAGHPRISFELDLFTALEQHWTDNAAYAQRKGLRSPVQTWAVGQAMALERALTVYQGPKGQEGAFPEFYFFDCHSCHRRIGDQADYRTTALANPGRPVAPGTVPFQDENMIMLSAAAKIAAPGMAAKFEGDTRAFHVALTEGRQPAIAAAARLRGDALALSSAFASHAFTSAETYAIVDAVANGAAERYTDYEASAQAVMALDTLLNALVKSGDVGLDRARAARPALDGAYQAVREPNAYQPLAFRAALMRAASAIRATR